MDKQLPLNQYITARCTYDKETVLIHKINLTKSNFAKHNYKIELQTRDRKIVNYYTNENRFDFYKEGNTITAYFNPWTGEIFILDLEKQFELIGQLLLIFLIIFIIMRVLNIIGRRSLAILLFIYLYIFKPLCYTPAIILLIYSNLTAHNSVSEFSEDLKLVTIIHIASIIIILVYLYDMYKLIYYYKKAKQLTEKNNE
jgi:hypothetical protein